MRQIFANKYVADSDRIDVRLSAKQVGRKMEPSGCVLFDSPGKMKAFAEWIN
jgi:hypothetical protein